MKVSNTLYEVLRFVAELLLPGLATLYCALAPIWGFPYAGQIASTIVAVDTFLGLITAYLRKRYGLPSEPLTDEVKTDE